LKFSARTTAKLWDLLINDKLLEIDVENSKPLHSEKYVNTDDRFVGCVDHYVLNSKKDVYVLSADTNLGNQIKCLCKGAKFYSKLKDIPLN
jgi:hypothetical protein